MIKRSKYEEYFKELFASLGFETNHLSRNRSGTQLGADIGWYFYNMVHSHFHEIKWRIEVKSTGLEAKKPPSKRQTKLQIYEKLFQSMSLQGSPFHCWCFVAPFLRLDSNEKGEFEEFNEKFLLPFQIVIWDESFLKNNLLSANPDLYSRLYDKPSESSKDNSILMNDILANTSMGLIKNHWFETTFTDKRKLLKNASYNLIIELKQTSQEQFYLISLHNQNKLVSKYKVSFDRAASLLTPINVKESLVKADNPNAEGTTKTSFIQKSKLIELLKNCISFNDSSKNLFQNIKYELKNGSDIFVTRVLTTEEMFKAAPFHELNSDDFEVYSGIRVGFLTKFLSESIKTARIRRVNNLLNKSIDSDEDVNFLISCCRDFELRWYLAEKILPPVKNLSSYDFLWQEIVKYDRPFRLFKIFEESVSVANADYILGFFEKHYVNFDKDNLYSRMFQEEALQIVLKTIKNVPESGEKVLMFVHDILSKLKISKRNRSIDHEREKQFIAQILFEYYLITSSKKQEQRAKKLIGLASSYFNLVDGDGGYFHKTPSEIFQILQEYIVTDFESRIGELVGIIIDQYKQYYSKDWQGWDLFGSGVSQSGNEFSIRDRHYVEMVLIPGIRKYYQDEPQKAWKFILANWISNEEEVSPDKPDFLNRASIPILLSEYAKGKHSDKALEILKDFIQMMRGIPSKTELIFQYVYSGQFELIDKQKWDLVKVQLEIPEYEGLADNIFIERITTELAQKGNKDARTTANNWLKNEKYRKQQRIGNFTVVENTWKLLGDGNSNDSLDAFKEYINSPEFVNQLDSYEAWDVAGLLAEKVLARNLKEGLRILEAIFKKEKLSRNEQILVCHAPYKAIEGNTALQKKIFNKYLKLNFKTINIESKITFDHARESLVKFAEQLAEQKNFSESLWIIEKMLSDSSPNKDDKSDYNLHRQIISGEDVNELTSVRGLFAWVLRKFTVVEGRPHLDKVIKIVESLITDSNYYVRQQACFPLMNLVRNRHSVMPGSKPVERYMTVQQAERIEKIAFDALNNKENHKLFSVMKRLGMVFSYMRSLDSGHALHVLNLFKSLDFSHVEKNKDHRGRRSQLISEVIREVSPIYLYYAEFRKDAFKRERNKQIYGLKKWKELNAFDPAPLRNLLKDMLKNEDDEVRENLVWQLRKMVSESDVPKSKAFEIAFKYLIIAAKRYGRFVAEDIYRFIGENVESNFDECMALWIETIRNERQFLIENVNEKTVNELYYLPYHKNGSLLVRIRETQGDSEFIKWFKFLLGYPKTVYIANDLDEAVNELKKFPVSDKRAKELFDLLVERNARFYDAKVEWES